MENKKKDSIISLEKGYFCIRWEDGINILKMSSSKKSQHILLQLKGNLARGLVKTVKRVDRHCCYL